MLRKNQINGIEISKQNNFNSGIHFHATGTGKSWIALNIILEFNKNKNNNLIFWITEKKSILLEQFTFCKLNNNGFKNIYDEFMILDYCKNKNKDWVNTINSSKIWGKSRLVIINRAFLTSMERYCNLTDTIDLIIHDECHSISNKSTQKFYNEILSKFEKLKCIGFSATPVLDYRPFNNILSKYSIYDAYIDNAILPPKIHWLKSENVINYENILPIIEDLIKELPYKKIIVWAGMIKLCNSLATEWKKYFSDFVICVDTSIKNNHFDSYDKFSSIDSNAILFCAAKHKEGSDIKNLDCCIFLDYVENRFGQTFIQSIGRVLRKDTENKKKYDLIIDIKAKSCISITDKMNKYMNIPKGTFPWNYSNYNVIIDKKNICINTLLLDKKIITDKIDIEDRYTYNYTEGDIICKFIKKIPDDIKYSERLETELNILKKKNLFGYILHALDILKISGDLIHVTRGSCGSSLICYLLGISHVDPIKYNIKFSRFMNEYRDCLPDVDFDFSHKMRDEIFLKLQINYPDKIARISNHVYFHEKSAKREAIRKAGIHKFIPKTRIDEEINSFDRETREYIKNETKNLEDSFKGYSLHCGGIVYYPNGIPEDLVLKDSNEKSLTQITLNKHDVADDKNFKIDILSSKALSQLYQSNNYQNIDFENTPYDKNIYDLLSSGNNIGITLGESPLIRKAFIKCKPTSLKDIAICLAIIRPAAKDANKELDNLAFTKKRTAIIFDDDAIALISKVIKCTECEADYFRRGFAKNDNKIIDKFMKKIRYMPESKKEKLMNKLSSLRAYSFCKSHSYSYAQLIYHLAYFKYYHPIKFWNATLNNCSSHYRKWVHIYEAKLAGVDVNKYFIQKNNKSIFAVNRNKGINELNITQQIRKYGYWLCDSDIFFPGGNSYYFVSDDIHHFSGLVASYRLLTKCKKKYFIALICYDKHKYLEIIINDLKYCKDSFIGIKGKGKMVNEELSIINAIKWELF